MKKLFKAIRSSDKDALTAKKSSLREDFFIVQIIDYWTEPPYDEWQVRS